jgi:hypothetical protein
MGRVVESYPVAPGVVVDVTAARDIVQGKKANARVDLRTMEHILYQRMASVRAWKVVHGFDCREPAILVKIAGIKVLVDGWHRCARARRLRKRRWYPAILLTEKQFREVSMESIYFVPPGTHKPRWLKVKK